MATKTCSKCKVEKDISEFYKNKRTKDGIRSHCKLCANRYTLDWIKRNPSKNLESVKRWTHENWDHVLEYRRCRYKKQKPKILDNTMEQYFEYLKTIEEQND